MPLVMGIDSSSLATKVEVRDADDGMLVASGIAPHPPAGPPRSEQDPGEWWDALVVAANQAGVRDIAALSVAGQQHGLVALDAAGAVLRPAKLWDDTESAEEAARMVDRVGADRWARACGSVPDAAFTITKLAWLARHEPRTYARLATVLLPHDLLTFRLTGRLVTDRGDASGTGYFSPSDDRWRPELLERAVGPHPEGPWAAKLPEILGPSAASDWMSASVNDVLGLRGRPLCGPGTGDSMALALGVGLEVGDVVVWIDRYGLVAAASERPTADGTGTVSGFADATGRFLPVVRTLNATLATDAIARVLGVDRHGLAELALSTPSAQGVVLLPHFAGERTPHLPEATGTLTGMGNDVTREQVARAAFEGVACSLLDGLDALEAAGVDVSGRLVLAGRGARSLAYQQLLADLSQREVVVVEDRQLVATGACVQAAAVLHGAPPDDVMRAWGLGDGDVVAPEAGPDPQAVREAYARALNR